MLFLIAQSNFIPNIVKAMKYAQNGPVLYEVQNLLWKG
jgi:hypothetical protein